MAEIMVERKRGGGTRVLLLVLLLLALAALAYWYFVLNRTPSPESTVAPATTHRLVVPTRGLALAMPTRPDAVFPG